MTVNLSSNLCPLESNLHDFARKMPEKFFKMIIGDDIMGGGKKKGKKKRGSKKGMSEMLKQAAGQPKENGY